MKTKRLLDLSNKQRHARTLAEIYRYPPMGAAKIIHNALVNEIQKEFRP